MYQCNLTNKDQETCCCETRDGKLYCTLTEKTLKECCCTLSGNPKEGEEK